MHSCAWLAVTKQVVVPPVPKRLWYAWWLYPSQNAQGRCSCVCPSDDLQCLQDAEQEKLRKMSPQDREKYEQRKKKIEQNRMMKKKAVRVG